MRAAAVTRIHVAVGVIIDGSSRVLIARRPDHIHQGGLWEFPGGKVEAGESLETALARELAEELDIRIGTIEPLLEVSHDYSDKSVLLDVCLVRDFSGEPRGLEGQPLRWVATAELAAYRFPAANQAIVTALLERLG
jgi:8-oxo-dGTP diphosphatase